ncbi:hypothetical protein [Synechococcus sp. BA-132 BA5]|uniref:hypothetical protein n=1 Tax=Synechococcus sp. BA-132 BA5 TaxID=3110252 RepID=UPI002B220644|nr:hypothetical protein [Synechococcus sp. BA-132 BA5]MEA5416608.1 hypothetical protein [Synechococcus sp. BA-132 BA5]
MKWFLVFSGVAAIAFSLVAGYSGRTHVMVAGLASSTVLLVFGNLEMFASFKASPGGFEAKTRDFVSMLPSSAKASLTHQTLGSPTDYTPFSWTSKTDEKDYLLLQSDITRSGISSLLSSVEIPELLTLHAWCNERNQHSLALQALLLAIAKSSGGQIDPETTSKNYSFAAASMRKLRRLNEAMAYSQIALDLNTENIDAKYNLALILKELGKRHEGMAVAREVMLHNVDYYNKRLMQEFPKLRA